jgi:signal transduction histidine kinase
VLHEENIDLDTRGFDEMQAQDEDVPIDMFNLILIMMVVFISGLGIIAYIRYYEKKKITQRLEKEILIKEKSEEALKLSETRFREANATKDKFFSILSHDLKSPFAAIMGIAEILEKEYDILKENDRINLIKELGKATRNTYTLLQELLTWSQSQRGLLNFDPRPFDLRELCNESIDIVNVAANTKSISLEIEINQGVMVNVDHNMVTTIFRNLLSNAIKFTQEGGKIQLHHKIEPLRQDNGQTHKMVSVIVTDNGIGISEDDIGKLLKIDEKFKNQGTNKESGTGMGLMICKEFVEKHGGKISIESEEGKGSSFGFTVPLGGKTI